MSLVGIAAVAAGCGGGESPRVPEAAAEPATVTAAPAGSADHPAPTEASRRDGPPSVTFDGETCTLAGEDTIDSGLVDVMVLNTSPDLSEAIFGQIAPGSTIEDVTAEVSAGDYDAFGERGSEWDPPPGLVARNPIPMPAGDVATRGGFAGAPGSWVVICLDLHEQRAFIAPTAIELR